MVEIIQDGSTGYTAKVDSTNRLYTQSLNLSIELDSNLTGNSYDVSTQGLVNLTDTSDSALLYVKNNGDNSLIVSTIFVDSTASNGSGSGQMTWHLNPTGGTLISDAVAAQVLNRRIGNPVDVAIDAYKASANGKTFTGSSAITFPLPAGVGIPFEKTFVIPKGQSFGASYQPPSGNTSMDIQVGTLIVVDKTQTA